MKSVPIFKKNWICCFTFALLVFSFAGPLFAENIQTSIILTTDTTSTKNQTVFTGFDTIYAMITVSGLAPGTHTVDISWVNSSGTVNQYTPVSIETAAGSPFTFYSWLKLQKNGPLKSNLTGKNFDAESLGKWELSVSIAEIFFKKISFTIQ